MFQNFPRTITIIAITLAAIVYSFIVLQFIGSRTLRKEWTDKKLYRFIPIFFAILAAISVLFTTLLFRGFAEKSHLSETQIMAITTSRSDDSQEKIQALQNRLNSLLTNLSLVTFTPTDSKPEIAQELKSLREALAVTQVSIKQIQDTMVTDPQKVISLPLIRSDMDNLHKEVASMQLAIQTQVQIVKEAQNQVYWTIGVLALGLLTLIIPVLKSAFVAPKD